MGVYAKAGSPYWWLWLERPGQKGLRESTKIPRVGSTPQKTKKLRQDAEDAYRVRMAELARSRYELPVNVPAANVVTFTTFAAWYERHKIPQQRGAERARELLARLVAFFGPHPLADLTDALVTEYETRRTTTDGRKPGTVNREVDLLKTILKAAVPRYLEASPIAERRRLRTTKIRKRTLEPHEEPLLLAQLPPRDQVLYLACVDTLVRLGDILDLQRADDHGTWLDLVDSKTGPYTVPVSARLRAGLDSLTPGESAAERPYYFWWRRRAKTDRDRRGAVRMMLQRACLRADLPYGRAIAGITWHTGTRATGATRMLRAGADPATVQSIGHWASLDQMSDYLSTTTPLQAAAVQLIGGASDFAALQAAGEAARKARAARPGPKKRKQSGEYRASGDRDNVRKPERTGERRGGRTGGQAA